MLTLFQNIILVIANGVGTTFVLDGWIKAAERVKTGGALSQLEIRKLGRYLYKLPLEPEWTDQLHELDELWSHPDPPRESLSISSLPLGKLRC